MPQFNLQRCVGLERVGGIAPGLFVELKGTQMSMIDLKSSTPKSGANAAIAMPNGKYKHGGNNLLAGRMIHYAIADVEDGVKFWKTIAGSCNSKRGFSHEFLNRRG